ncbi:PAS domain S-box protein [Nocardioides sp. dk4132]|uniref:sensor histidine kinase n=1 Tax=unclassified Nocardioides TaxID=2615069 RepID=UPI0012961095|nr:MULTISPECIES: sensor histidine kinase [unclassified Nocardioides]MQW76749.1 PAS domain S-box protein [Nocardioides sp. dk4132]QGA06895.1 PAS domain S-box protein [Nocardioides sp. dk884]
MNASAGVRVPALVVLLAVTGFVAVQAAPSDGHVIGIWPAGLATVVVLAADRRWRTPLTLVIMLLALATIWGGGRPAEVALGYALGIAAETCVAVRLLGRGHHGRPRLIDDSDLVRYFLATAAAGLVAGVVAALTSVLTGWGTPWFVGLGIGVAHWASQLCVVPVFARLPAHGAVARRRERVAQWLTILVVVPVVFIPRDFPSLAFVVIPLLAWTALRSRPMEALVQMWAVVGCAIAMTTFDLGPFAGAPALYGLDHDTRGVLLALYAATCALIVVPLVQRVGVHIATSRAARGERDRLQNVVRSTPGVAIIGTDPVGRVTLFNPGAESLLGYSAEEMLGSPIERLFSPESIRLKAAEVGVSDDFVSVVRALVDPAVGQTSLRFLRRDGEERDHVLTLSRITADDGATLGFVSTSEDVTERLQAENALKQAVERLRQVDAVKDAFVSSVSHELRTPITSIQGYLELLEDGSYGDLNAPQLNAVRRVAGNSRRLLGLIDDLLTLSKMQEESSIVVVERAFDLRLAVETGYGLVTPVLERRRLTMSLSLPSEPVPFLGDRDMVERLVVNLVGNAVKFTPDEGTVAVALEIDGEETLLRVTDTGIGIPLEEQQHLFQRFFRSELAQKHAIQGSGLGLSISRAVVERHRGTIDVVSDTGAGTTFVVRMPLVA